MAATAKARTWASARSSPKARPSSPVPKAKTRATSSPSAPKESDSSAVSMVKGRDTALSPYQKRRQGVSVVTTKEELRATRAVGAGGYVGPHHRVETAPSQESYERFRCVCGYTCSTEKAWDNHLNLVSGTPDVGKVRRSPAPYRISRHISAEILQDDFAAGIQVEDISKSFSEGHTPELQDPTFPDKMLDLSAEQADTRRLIKMVLDSGAQYPGAVDSLNGMCSSPGCPNRQRFGEYCSYKCRNKCNKEGRLTQHASPAVRPIDIDFDFVCKVIERAEKCNIGEAELADVRRAAADIFSGKRAAMEKLRKPNPNQSNEELQCAINEAIRTGVSHNLVLSAARTLAERHPGGIVLWAGSEPGRLPSNAIESERGVLHCVTIEITKEFLRDIKLGSSIVCLVCRLSPGFTRVAVTQLAGFLRRGEYIHADDLAENPQATMLRSVPMLVVNAEPDEEFSESGCVVVTDPSKVDRRVLSLPSLRVIRSEASAGMHKGSTTDLRFGHLVDKSKDMLFTESEKVLLNSVQRSRLPWYEEVGQYEEHIAELEAYMHGLQPVHRCKPGVFLAILREGGLMSRDELTYLLDTNISAILRTARHVRLIELANDPTYQHVRRDVFKYAEAICELRLANNEDQRKAAEEKRVEARRWLPKELDGCSLERLETVVADVVKDVLVQEKEATIDGIGYAKDKILGTSGHVFATMGPNLGYHYGSVVIILNRNLLFHPGFWCTPLAATGFVGPNFWVFRHRPWGGAALLDMAVHGRGEDVVASVEHVPDTPAEDAEGVDACIKSALNMAAMDNYARIMAREVDAMCHYVVFGHREPHSFDLPFDAKKCREFRSKLHQPDGSGGSEFRRDAWKSVIEYYETKDSHTLYECHLPGFVPIGAIEKVIVSNKLYEQHSGIKEKVDTFVLPDGRRLKDLMVFTKTTEECTDWQQQYFDQRRQECRKKQYEREPISVYVAGLKARPCFLPPDFSSWHASRGMYFSNHGIGISFACRSTHDIRVTFSRTARLQRKDVDLRDSELTKVIYHFCLGMCFNTQSYITKGVRGQKPLIQKENDSTVRCTAAGEGENAGMVWERYWFHVQQQKGTAVLSCGKGPMFENVMMEAVDPKPITGLCYVGLSCWNQPAIYCDLQASSTPA